LSGLWDRVAINNRFDGTVSLISPSSIVARTEMQFDEMKWVFLSFFLFFFLFFIFTAYLRSLRCGYPSCRENLEDLDFFEVKWKKERRKLPKLRLSSRFFRFPNSESLFLPLGAFINNDCPARSRKLRAVPMILKDRFAQRRIRARISG